MANTEHKRYRGPTPKQREKAQAEATQKTVLAAAFKVLVLAVSHTSCFPEKVAVARRALLVFANEHDLDPLWLYDQTKDAMLLSERNILRQALITAIRETRNNEMSWNHCEGQAHSWMATHADAMGNLFAFVRLSHVIELAIDDLITKDLPGLRNALFHLYDTGKADSAEEWLVWLDQNATPEARTKLLTLTTWLQMRERGRVLAEVAEFC